MRQRLESRYWDGQTCRLVGVTRLRDSSSQHFHNRLFHFGTNLNTSRICMKCTGKAFSKLVTFNSHTLEYYLNMSV